MSDELSRRLRLLFENRRGARNGTVTLAEVAEATGISVSYLWRLRAGKTRNPTKQVLEKLAEFFRVPVSYFTDSGLPQLATELSSQDVEQLFATARERLIRRDVDGALSILRDAVTKVPSSADRILRGRILSLLARALAAKGELSEAEQTLTEARELLGGPTCGVPWYEATLVEAIITYGSGNRQDAYLIAREVVKALQQWPDVDPNLELRALVYLGQFAWRVARAEEAFQCFEQAVGLARRQPDSPFLAPAVLGLGLALLDLGRPNEALEQFEYARDLYVKLGMTSEVAAALHNLGLAHQLLQNWFAALEDLTKSLGIYEALGLTREAIYSVMEIAWCYANIGIRERAFLHGKRALTMAEVDGYEEEQGWALVHLGMVYRQFGELEQSAECFKEAMDIFRAGRLTVELALASIEYANLLVSIGRSEEALTAYRQSVESVLPESVANRLLAHHVVAPASQILAR